MTTNHPAPAPDQVPDPTKMVAPPAEGEVGKLVAKLRRLALQNPLGTADPTITRAADLLQQQAAELAMLRQMAVPVPVDERPWENKPGWLDPDGECWWCPPDGPAYWSMANPAMVYGGWLLPAHAIPVPPKNRPNGYPTPARLRHCSTHGQQPPEAWGCPECLRELREELAAARLQQQQPSPPAEGELVDLADAVTSWAARLDEGTPEERLLGRVSAVLRQRQAPPNEGEVDALIKVLSRLARMLDFMPDGPPKGLIIHRAIELLRQLAPPAEGEVGELVAWIYRQATHGPDGDKWRRTANLLQRQAAELAECREALRRVRRWGSTFGSHYSSAVAMGVMDWIDAGMTGPLTAMPEYLEGRPHA